MRRLPYAAFGQAMRGLLEVACAADPPMRPRELRVLLAVLHSTLSWGRTADSVSHGELAAVAGVDASHIRRELRSLEGRGLVVYTAGHGRGNRSTLGVHPRFTGAEDGPPLNGFREAESGPLSPPQREAGNGPLSVRKGGQRDPEKGASGLQKRGPAPAPRPSSTENYTEARARAREARTPSYRSQVDPDPEPIARPTSEFFEGLRNQLRRSG